MAPEGGVIRASTGRGTDAVGTGCTSEGGRMNSNVPSLKRRRLSGSLRTPSAGLFYPDGMGFAGNTTWRN